MLYSYTIKPFAGCPMFSITAFTAQQKIKNAVFQLGLFYFQTASHYNIAKPTHR